MIDDTFGKQGEDTIEQLKIVLPKTSSLEMENLDGVKMSFPVSVFSAYKTAQVMQMLARVKDQVDVVALITEIQMLATNVDASSPDADRQNAQKIYAAFSAIPKLMEIAPDLLFDFGALATLSNKEIKEAYENGTLNTALKNRRAMIEFEFPADAPLNIFAAYLPYLGIDFLKKAIARLNNSVTVTLNQM